MFEDLNIPFCGVLLDPLIEDSCGPLINCDSCSTFDETLPFLTSCNFQVEGLKHLYFFCSKEYLMKIHFSTFGFSFNLFSLGKCMYAM
jgi:hypothetical protein